MARRRTESRLDARTHNDACSYAKRSRLPASSCYGRDCEHALRSMRQSYHLKTFKHLMMPFTPTDRI